MMIFMHFAYGYFHTTMTVLNGYDKDCMAGKAKNIIIWFFTDLSSKVYQPLVWLRN
jgi:hypothetical protein